MINFSISNRLKKIASYIKKDEKVADIGTDHGFLPIYLVRQNITKTIVAVDVNKKPLEKAKENATEYGVFSEINFKISNGLKNIQEDIDTYIISGMGGMLIINILKEAMKDLKMGQKFVLSPQADTVSVRKFLYENGFDIKEESLLKENNWFYNIFYCQYDGIKRNEDEFEYLFGLKHLTKDSIKTYKLFLEHENKVLNDVLFKIKDRKKLLKKVKTIKKEISLNEIARRKMEMKDKIKVAIMGYGVVGNGVYDILLNKQKTVEKKTGLSFEVKYVLDIREFDEERLKGKLIHDVNTIVNDDEVSVVIETMGGVEPAFTFVKSMLLAKKHVCTSNKALVESKGAYLLEIAKENKVSFLFEAAVGGAIPIIRPLKDAISGDDVESITGILNGTTNYILTKMDKEGLSFEKALRLAQENGYAEADPTADVCGHDSCRKIAILASLVTNKTVSFEEIYTEGIDKISKEDLDFVKEMGMKIKLLTRFKVEEDGLNAITAPFVINDKNPLFFIDDVVNAVLIKTDMAGELLFSGAGAGSIPTASAVVGDVVDSIWGAKKEYPIAWTKEKEKVKSHKKNSFKYFVRFKNEDLKNNPFTFEKSIQIGDETAIITEKMQEEEKDKILENIKFESIIRMAD